MAATYLGLALLSAAALAFEITLTRLFSVTQWYHFAFLAVSVALLGYGASGTALSLRPRWAKPPTARRSSTLSILFAAAVVGAYLSLNHLPFDSYRIAWERIQLLYLVLFSFAHFYEGWTGLTVTVGAIVTLFVVMQLTARVDWGEVFPEPASLSELTKRAPRSDAKGV